MSNQYDFGLVGLGVMGRNFILNVADNGFSAYGLDTDPEKVSALKNEGDEEKVSGTTDKKEFVKNLSQPRKIMMLVPAGGPVDSVIEDLLPLLDEGDLLIDGGNSFYEDTNRREAYLKEKGIHFFGSGVSGGAKGARFGPSIMPGGDRDAYEIIRPVFEAASAKVNGEPCVDYMGATSAGNYVKMVHNGIEYGLMQLIAESYDLLKNLVGLENEDLNKVFTQWNEGRLKSFLIEITSEIFQKKDDLSDHFLVDVILDKAKQKGTGKWTSQNAMDLGVAIPTIDGAVSMRGLSSLKETRGHISSIYDRQHEKITGITTEDVENALLFAFIVTYSQGMTQLKVASDEYNYGLNMETIAKIWRGGCIIRSVLLEDMRQAYDRDPDLSSLIADPDLSKMLKETAPSTRKVLAAAIQNEVPVMCLSACVSYFDAIKSERLPLNLVQAQRDHFGSHTYERIDRDGIFHTEW